MTESLKPSIEPRADWNKKMERVREEQEWRISTTVNEWMQDEGTVENALLEAIKEVSGDMALLIAAGEKDKAEAEVRTSRVRLMAMALLVTQIRKQMREDVQEKLYG